MQRTHVNQ